MTPASAGRTPMDQQTPDEQMPQAPTIRERTTKQTLDHRTPGEMRRLPLSASARSSLRHIAQELPSMLFGVITSRNSPPPLPRHLQEPALGGLTAASAAATAATALVGGAGTAGGAGRGGLLGGSAGGVGFGGVHSSAVALTQRVQPPFGSTSAWRERNTRGDVGGGSMDVAFGNWPGVRASSMLVGGASSFGLRQPWNAAVGSSLRKLDRELEERDKSEKALLEKVEARRSVGTNLPPTSGALRTASPSVSQMSIPASGVDKEALADVLAGGEDQVWGLILLLRSTEESLQKANEDKALLEIEKEEASRKLEKIQRESRKSNTWVQPQVQKFENQVVVLTGRVLQLQERIRKLTQEQAETKRKAEEHQTKQLGATQMGNASQGEAALDRETTVTGGKGPPPSTLGTPTAGVALPGDTSRGNPASIGTATRSTNKDILGGEGGEKSQREQASSMGGTHGIEQPSEENGQSNIQGASRRTLKRVREDQWHLQSGQGEGGEPSQQQEGSSGGVNMAGNFISQARAAQVALDSGIALVQDLVKKVRREVVGETATEILDSNEASAVMEHLVNAQLCLKQLCAAASSKTGSEDIPPC